MTDRIKGYTGKVPDGDDSFDHALRESVSGLKNIKTTSRDQFDNEIITKSFASLFRKIIYDPATPSDEQKVINAVSILFTKINVMEGFTTVAGYINEICDTQLAHANYMKDYFIPDMISYYDGWVGNVLNSIPYLGYELWEEEDVAPYKEWWVGWANSSLPDGGGYNSYVNSIGEVALNISVLASIVSGIVAHPEIIKITNTGHIYPIHDITAQKMEGATVWIDCARVPTIVDIQYPQGATEYAKNQLKEDAAEILYNSISRVGTAGTGGSMGTIGYKGVDEQYLLVYVNTPEIGGYLTPGADCNYKGAISKSSQSLYILITHMNAFISLLSSSATLRVEIYITEGDQTSTILEYPADVDYIASNIPTRLRLGQRKNVKIGMRIKGRMVAKTKDFGYEIVPDEIDPNDYVTLDWQGDLHHKAYFLVYKGPQADPLVSLADNWFLRTFYSQNGGYNRYVDLSSFSAFAAVYYDHPLVTGTDIYPTKPDLLASELLEVNELVNHTYTYQSERSGRDVWNIMNSLYSHGDCEDFAITKADYLLRRGWPISHLYLAKGATAGIDSPSGGYGRVGHMWLVAVTSSGATYVLDNESDALESESSMWAEYLNDKCRQVSGMRWADPDGANEVTLEPYGTYEFNEVLFEADAILTPHYQKI